MPKLCHTCCDHPEVVKLSVYERYTREGWREEVNIQSKKWKNLFLGKKYVNTRYNIRTKHHFWSRLWFMKFITQIHLWHLICFVTGLQFRTSPTQKGSFPACLLPAVKFLPAYWGSLFPIWFFVSFYFNFFLSIRFWPGTELVVVHLKSSEYIQMGFGIKCSQILVTTNFKYWTNFFSSLVPTKVNMSILWVMQQDLSCLF